jgi:cytochrome c
VRPNLLAALLVSSFLFACGACGPASGDGRGVTAIRKYGCGSCHTIPGISGANGLVGPSLARMGSRIYVAGELPNQPDALARWIQNPKAIHPTTAMPVLGVTHRDAADIAGYLSSLR